MNMKYGMAIAFGMLMAWGSPLQAANLDFPLERQVFQRNAEEFAEVKVAGRVSTHYMLANPVTSKTNTLSAE